MLEEENAILIWYVNRKVRTFNKDIQEFTPEAAAIGVGFDLWLLSKIYPPSPSMVSLCQAWLPSKTPLTLQTAIAQLPKDWEPEKIDKLKDFEDLCPILTAIQTSREFPDVKVWSPMVKKKTNLNLSQKLFPAEIAFHLVLERELLHKL